MTGCSRAARAKILMSNPCHDDDETRSVSFRCRVVVFALVLVVAVAVVLVVVSLLYLLD